MADPPRGDRPQYNVYRAGEDDPEREADRPREQGQQPAPAAPPQGAPQQPAQGHPQQPQQQQPPPQYNVYKSGSGLRDRVAGGPGKKQNPLKRLFKRSPRQPDQPQPWAPEKPRRSPGRIALKALKYALVASAAWLLLSLVLFFVSAGTHDGVDSRTEDALAGGGSLLTGSTILVLGSDERPSNIKEPGAGGPSRSDSILLVHVGLGSTRQLSIPRDSVAEIPGHGTQKINAAFALGGAPLMIETVENFLGNGVKINHIIQVDFESFPELIDSLGGIDVTLRRRLCAEPFAQYGPGRGRKTFKLPRGTNHLNGEQALAYARVRKNRCSPGENDRHRAARQQQVLGGIKSSAFSVRSFFHAPWIAWNAPRAVKSDLAGPGMTALALDIMTGGSGSKGVLKPETLDPFIVSDQEKKEEAERLLGK